MKQQAADPEEVWRIIRLIDSDPHVRDEIRRAILIRELLELPQHLAAFIEAADHRFRALENDLAILKTDVGVLKDDSYERRVRERAPAILHRIAGGFRRLRVIATGDLADQLDEAVDAGKISDRDRDEILEADAVARGISRSSGQAAHLAIEASVTLGNADVVRAIRRSRLLSQAFVTEGVAVVVTARVPGHLSTDGAALVVFGSEQERGAAERPTLLAPTA